MNRPTRMELMPGVFLTAIQTRKFKSSFWSVYLLAPLQAETAAMNALLPRVLRQGTDRCPDQIQLGSALNQLYGGIIEPVVSKWGEVQVTGFLATFLDDALTLDGSPIYPPAAELLGDLLLRPATRRGRLRPDYVERERDNLIAEIRSRRNDKLRYSAARLVQEMCADEAYGIDAYGTVESAEKINVTKLDRHYRTLLAQSRIELYYCGSASPERVREAWEEALLGLPRRGIDELPQTPVEYHPEEVRTVVEHMPVNQAKLALGFRTQTPLNGTHFAELMMLNAVYGGTVTSKLFQNVRERLSLCYYASSALDRHKGLLSVHSGVAFDRIEAAKAEILAQLEEIRQGNLSRQEIEDARAYVLNQLKATEDTQSALAGHYNNQTLAEFPVSPAELASLIREVSPEGIVEVAKRLELDTIYILTGMEEEEAANGTT